MSSPGRQLLPFVQGELAVSVAAIERGDRDGAWRSLERAHILSQPAAWLHTKVHWRMLTLALRSRDWREVAGQVVRIAVAAIGSAAGRFPAGNSGRARVSLTANAPIPEDVAVIFANLGIAVAGSVQPRN